MVDVQPRFKAIAIDGKKHIARLKGLPCCIYACSWFGCDLHHERRGAGGGTALKPGPETLIPLCHAHHQEGHQIGWATFEKKYGVDLREVARGQAIISRAMGLLPREEST